MDDGDDTTEITGQSSAMQVPSESIIKARRKPGPKSVRVYVFVNRTRLSSLESCSFLVLIFY